MMDAQVSYVRLLIGDNSRTAPVYTDAQLRAAVQNAIKPTREALPAGVRAAALLAFNRFPKG